MAACVKLIVSEGPLKGRKYRFIGHTYCTVGRDPACLLSLQAEPPDTTASRRHCRFDIDPPRVTVLDLGSRNGTFVNGERFGGRDLVTGLIPPGTPLGAELRDGDTVRVGATCFRVAVEVGLIDGSEPEPPAVLAELVRPEAALSGAALVGA